MARYLFHLTMGIIHRNAKSQQLHIPFLSFVCENIVSTKLDEWAHYSCAIYNHYSLMGVNLIYLGYSADVCFAALFCL